MDNFTYESVNYPTLIVLTNQENKYFKKFFINKLKVNHTDKFDITLDKIFKMRFMDFSPC